MTGEQPANVQQGVVLTERQQRVVALMAAGKTNWEIAQDLGLSLEGAKYHVSEVIARYGVTTREEAVARWRDERRPIARTQRGLRAALGALGAKSFLTKTTITLVAVAGVVLSAVLVYLGREDQLREAREEPQTAEEFLAAMDETLGQGGILHVTFNTQGSSDGVDYDMAVESWFDFQEGKALIEYEQQWANEDVPRISRELLDGQQVYIFDGTPPAVTRTTMDEIRPPCLPSTSYLAAILACGILPGSEDIDPASMGLVSTTDALGVAYESHHAVTPSPDGFAPPTPTPAPGTPTVPATASATITTRYTYLARPDTMLPLRLDVFATHSEQGELGRWSLVFDSEMLDRGDVDLSIFDARAQGYRTPDEIEIATLDAAVPGGPLYWLGHMFTPTGFPQLQLARVEQRFHPERPELIALDYDTAAGDRVTLAMWKEDDWHDFLGRLQGYEEFVFSAGCLETDDVIANGISMRILTGAVRDARQACPASDTYMAEVYVADGYVLTINAPIALPDRGPAYEAFDSPDALIAIAMGLRPRQAGE